VTDSKWLEDYFHRRIPLTASMGLKVDHYDGRSIRLSAPLAPNTNDKETAFGGSLAALLTVAGWGLLHMKLRDLGKPVNIVIHKSEFIYNQPVVGDFSAYCDLPADDLWQRFLTSLERRGRARVVLTSWIAARNNAAVTMEGRYAALLTKDR
jgi:thioesterase domain-containing protein